MLNLTTASTAELVAFYNANAETPVKRFSDRKTAERRCAALLPKPRKSGREAIAASWSDPEVRAARLTHHNVMVTDAQGATAFYRSVTQAFETIGLPLGESIRFRMQLKAAGNLEGYGFHWMAMKAN
jgi:glycerol-3-phosphate dehydrogenase